MIYYNSAVCNVNEYAFKDQTMDIGIATITGRYPDIGYCLNAVSKELVYVLKGTGKLYLENDSFEYKLGDSFLIDSNEKYYWESEYSEVALISNSAWSYEQYQNIN